MSTSFGTTISSGIQDLSAILSLFGTEECELHVGSALRGGGLGGYLYAAITPLSIFGSLGPAKAAFTIMLTSIPLVGARTLRAMGFEPKGDVMSLTMAKDERNCYEAETRLDELLHRHILQNNAQNLLVDRPHIPRKFRLQPWNFKLLVASLLFACLGVTPYIHFSVLHHTSFPALALFFPFCRVAGGLLCVFPGQLLLQYRIEMILKQRLLFTGINYLLKCKDVKVPTQYIHPWDETYASEACLSALYRFLQTSPVEARNVVPFIKVVAQGLRLSEEPSQTAGPPLAKRLFPQVFRFSGKPPEVAESPSAAKYLTKEDIALALKPYLTNRGVWIALLIPLLFGFVMTLIGYVGCFTIVQNSPSPSDTYIWLGAEAALALIRLLVWAWNPPWDASDGVWLRLDHSTPLPIQATLGTAGNTTQRFDIIPDSTFWDFLTAHSGPVNILEVKKIQGFRQWYSWVRRETGEETLCIVFKKPDSEEDPILCTMSHAQDLEFHRADIVSNPGHAVPMGPAEVSWEFKLDVFEHYSFIMSTKTDFSLLKVSWPLLQSSVNPELTASAIPDVDHNLRDPELGTDNAPNAWKKLQVAVEKMLKNQELTYNEFKTCLKIISDASTSRGLHQQLSTYLSTHTKEICQELQKSADLVHDYDDKWRSYFAGTSRLSRLFKPLNPDSVTHTRGKKVKGSIESVEIVAVEQWNVNVLHELSDKLLSAGMASDDLDRVLASFVSQDLKPKDLRKMRLRTPNPIIFALETLGSVSSNIPLGSILSSVIDPLLDIMDRIEKTSSNAEGLIQLAVRIERLAPIVSEMANERPAQGRIVMEALTRELQSITRELNDVRPQGKLEQFFNATDNASSLARHNMILTNIIADATLFHMNEVRQSLQELEAKLPS